MYVHHLNCASMCPVGGKFLSVFPSEIVCHCWLIDTGVGLLLVDTGIGSLDVASPKRLGMMRHSLGFQLSVEETALHQVEALGYRGSDVRWIIPTHLDLDHAGGIADFPEAEVHIWEDEYQCAHAQGSWLDRQRYRACQWSEHGKWKRHKEVAGEAWFGFDAVREISGLPPELLLVPLPGHSVGHWGVALKTKDGWLFHVGDAYYDHRELSGRGSLGLSMFQRVVHHDYKAAIANQARLKQLNDEQSSITMVCAHDPERI